MNVGQLKERLSELPDDMEVTVRAGEWLYGVRDVYQTVTIEYESINKYKAVVVIQPLYIEEPEEVANE